MTISQTIEVLMKASGCLSEALAGTDISDSVGRDLRLVDLLVGLGVNSIKIGIRCRADDKTLAGGVATYVRTGVQHLEDLQNWLRDHPRYMSSTSDGRQCGRPVDGTDIALAVNDVLTLLRPLAPDESPTFVALSRAQLDTLDAKGVAHG